MLRYGLPVHYGAKSGSLATPMEEFRQGIPRFVLGPMQALIPAL